MRMRTDGHKQVKWLETGLKEMNRSCHGTGLGFVVYGTVVDTRMLGFGAAKLASGFVSAITIVLGLQPLYETRQLQACGLDQNVKLFVEACVGACPAKSSVNSTLLTHNCTSIPAPCVECMAPLLARREPNVLKCAVGGE
jgi:hypothetical protein